MLFIGIDISKDCFDVAIPTGTGFQSARFANERIGFEQFEQQLKTRLSSQACPVVQPACVMEATGPYYLRLATFLHQHGIGVCVVNPLVIKRFSQLKLSRTKTDKADARLIAQYGHLHQPPCWQPPTQLISELQQESSLLEQLLKQRTALGNHLHALLEQAHVSEKARQSLEQLLASLDEQIGQLQDSIARKAQSEYNVQLQALLSIPGIGIKTAIALLVTTHGFERFDSSRQLSAYVGLAPACINRAVVCAAKSTLPN